MDRSGAGTAAPVVRSGGVQRPFRTRPALGLAALLGLVALAPAAAQPGPPAADGPDAPPPLPYVLRLRTEQAGAWRAYKDELALERAEAAHAAGETAQLAAMTTPERLDWSTAQLPRQEEQARRRAAAVRAFYAVLSPNQRRTFDRVTGPPVAPPPERRAARGDRPSLPLPPRGAGLPAPYPSARGG